MNEWMRALAQHYERIRQRHPDDELLLVLDIDGTIIDGRHALLELLRNYDNAHGTAHAAALPLDSVTGEDWSRDIGALALDAPEAARLGAFLERHDSEPSTALASHTPFRGVMEIIRWFQLQPNTSVALNSGRPESHRLLTLRALNAIGAEFRVSFPSELLLMRAPDQDRQAAKRAGLQRLAHAGYRVFAVVDDDAEMLQAVRDITHPEQTLTLHASTVVASQRQPGGEEALPAGYDLQSFMGTRQLPRHVQFVWSHLHSEIELQRFLTSEIRWGEVSVGRFANAHPGVGDRGLPLGRIINAMAARNRRCKLNIADAGTLHRLLEWLEGASLPADRLWFQLTGSAATQENMRTLAAAHPHAIRQCNMDTLAPALAAGSPAAVDTLHGWNDSGATRFGLAWFSRGKNRILDTMDAHGYDLHFGDIPNLEAFLHASLLLPRSLSARFDFHQWQRPQRQRLRRAG